MATMLKRNGTACHSIKAYGGSDKQTIATLGGVRNSPSPTLYYTFDTGSGTTIVDRSVGTTAHSGTFAGGAQAPSWDDAAPKKGSHSFFTEEVASVDDTHATIADHADLDFDHNTAWSFSAWVKAEDTSWRALLSKRDTSGNDYTGWYIGTQGGRLDVYLVSDWDTADQRIWMRGSASSPHNTLANGSWHHLCVTYSGNGAASGFKSYVDGINDSGLAAENATHDAVSGSCTNSLAARVGSDSATGGLAFGDTDELALWKGIVLTAAQVAQLYNSGGTPPAITRGL